jgi:hypothetical protein
LPLGRGKTQALGGGSDYLGSTGPGSYICRMKYARLFLFGSLFCVTSAFGQKERRLVADLDWSAPVGANDLLTIHDALCQAQDRVLPHRFTDESNFGSKFVGRFYRLAKWVLLENVVDQLAFLTQHEVYGHGARVRELYSPEDLTYKVHLFFPYGNGKGETYMSYEAFARTEVTIAGSQASRILAEEQKLRVLPSGRMSYRESNMYLLGMLDLTQYILQTHNAGPASNDISNFLYRVYGEKEDEELKKLHRYAWLNLLDPMQFYAAYNLLANYIRLGYSDMEIPMISIGSYRYLPQFRLGLTPTGYEFFLENYLTDSITTLNAYGALGAHKESYRIGAKIRNLIHLNTLNIDMEFAGWYQDHGQSSATPYGGMINLTPKFAFWRGEYTTWLMIQLGLKTVGFQEGEPIGAGPIFRFGLTFTE